MNNVTLALRAEGKGSRFGGGTKQLEPEGQNGKITMNYLINKV